MGGTGLNLKGVKDAKSSENENDGGADVTYSSVDQVQALHVVLRQPAPDPNTSPNGTTLTVQNNSQESALRSLGPVNQINRNETADNQLKAAADATTKIAVAGAQLEKITKMGDPGVNQVAANMTPVTPAPSIPPPTMGGGSYTSTRKRDRSEETVWKPAAYDANLAAVNFTAASTQVQDLGPRTQLGQRLDLGTIGGPKTSLDGMDTKGIGTRIAQTGATLNSIQSVARMINNDAGRENKGPALAYKPPTPVSTGPSVPTGLV